MEISTVRDRPGHTLFWWGGFLLALLPYLLLKVNPAWRAPWILEPGQFAENVIIAVSHLMIGATLGGWLWFLVNRINPINLAKAWWKMPKPLNWIWFSISLAIYSLHNILVLYTLPFGPGELIAACAGRILTALIVLSLIWLATHIASLAAPRKFHLIPWLVPAIIPGFMGADTLSIIFWKNSARYVINKIDEDGPINLERQLSAAGFEMSSFEAMSILLIFIVLLSVFCMITGYFSKKITPRFHFRPHIAASLLAMAWLSLTVEKASGFAWKSRKALQMEYNSYDVHLTPIKPQVGVASFSASWRPNIAQPNKEETAPATPIAPVAKKPDIYLFLIESARRDALDPAHTPFLCDFRDHESQPLGETWAASNATHLSWYSIFNGQIPPYWRAAMDIVREEKNIPASPLIQLLSQANYRQEVRAVCDLSYNGMGSTNFGLPHQVHVLEEAANDNELDQLTVPEREVEIIRQAKESLLASPSGGNFHVLALDSPHFGYHWHENFIPPYTEYDPSAMFHAYPEEEDIQRVRNRYLNALAWTDTLVAEFVRFLKQENRYDDSIIIITGDHGEEFHENGSWFHCSSLEREQTAVPLLIKWPKNQNAPAQKSASHLDILPSLMDHLGHPKSHYAHLPGRSLLEIPSDTDEEATQITLTSFCGITGISMSWQRAGYTANFRWKNPWAIRLPKSLHLDDIIHKEGSLNLQTSEEWEAALRLHFPDAIERFFSEFERQVTDSRLR